MNKNTKFLMSVTIALMMDGLDFIGGFLPIVGDIADVIGIVCLFPLIGKYALVSGVELIPFLDFLPFFTVSVIVWKMKGT